MHIESISVTSPDPSSAGAFYRDVLGMPIKERANGLQVTIGASELRIRQGPAFEGSHHLAIGLAPEAFDETCRWLSSKIELITLDGSAFLGGPEGWNSRSVYFHGPDGSLLEFIARQADSGRKAGGSMPAALSISEIGLGVGNVTETVRQLVSTFGLPVFKPQTETFTPVGDDTGLLIVVDRKRLWFPTRSSYPADGPLEVRITSNTGKRSLALGNAITVLSD